MKDIKSKNVEYIYAGTTTTDGAGVKLKRIFGGHESAVRTDPFLLLDHFGSNKPEEYLSGFPWHPHRGIETVTYLLEGKVEHQDSEGNRGTIYPSDIQWMSAASGIFHQEMPKPLDDKDPKELLRTTGMTTSSVGFQLWINMPAKIKMSTPMYNGIQGKTTPVVDDGNGSTVKIVAGEYLGTGGSLKGRSEVDPTYLDVRMDRETEFTFPVKTGYTSIIYSIAGEVMTGSTGEKLLPGSAAVFGNDGDTVSVSSRDSSGRFIFLSGKPLREPIYWYGPIVMNTREQINEALRDLQSGSFIRDKNPIFQ
ncbi:MAG: hypothetical protein B2I17_06285 [Thermoplasmatales archaeon B_DKE]|nr:MAG: hypothetical protein B2I17_06285 [Thermoplasmatales archaeon B_DKE]